MGDDLRFVDTNVLVYLFDGDAPGKQEVARRILTDRPEDLVLSIQVLGEFYVSVTRKLAEPLAPESARNAVADLCALSVRPILPSLVLTAVQRSQTSQISYWDALIVESAIDAGAEVLLTEDLQHGQRFGRLRVVNPFLDEPRNDIESDPAGAVQPTGRPDCAGAR